MNTFEPRNDSNNPAITEWLPLTPHNIPDKTATGASDTVSVPFDSSVSTARSEQPTSDYSVIYKMQSLPNGAIWFVSCEQQQANQLGLDPGEYTLASTDPDSHVLKARSLERLLTLDNPDSVATLLMQRETDHHQQLWYEPLGAGTLDTLLSVRTALRPAEVTKLAEQISRALNWVHQQSFAYSALTAQQIAFTLDTIEPKLLAPTIDFRGAPASVISQHKAQDIREFSAIIWQALTGHAPEDTITRKPLSLFCPDAPEALAQILELALDAPANAQPQLAEITAALASYAKATPIELHVAVHPSVKGRLPARISAPSQPRQQGGKTSVKPVSGLLSKAKKPTTRNSNKRSWKLAAMSLAGIAVIGAAGWTLVDSDTATQQQVEVTAAEQPDITNPSPSIHTSPATAEATKTSPQDMESVEQDIPLIFEKRNEVLAKGDGNGIDDYAVLTSDVARADGELISRDTDRSLAEQPLSVVEITDIQVHQDDAEATVTVRSERSEFAGDNGISEVNGGAEQRVHLTLKHDSNRWKLVKAEPISS